MGGRQVRWTFWILAFSFGCGDGGRGEGSGRLEMASVVAPLYAGVEVRYKAVGDRKSCDSNAEGEVSGAASRGDGFLRSYDFAYAREALELPAGHYGICATVFDANGQVEARCPTSAIKTEVVAGAASTAYFGIVCDPVIDERSGHAYTVTPLVNSFLEAKAVAEQMGGHLVYIDDMEENLMLGKHFARRKWIGLWDGDGDRTFEWIDGKQREFSNFCIGEPNAQAGEYYAEWGFGVAADNYCWNNETWGTLQGIVEFE